MEENHQNGGPGFAKLASRLAATGVGLLENRAELLAVELQEEKLRVIKLLIWGLGLLFLSVLAMVLLTATIIFLVPEDKRVLAAGGFTLLYGVGAVVAVFMLKSALKKLPFGETLNQARKDREWLASMTQ